MDITYFEHTTREGGLQTYRTTTPDAPGWLIQQARGNVETVKVTLHLEVGTPVLVRAYGRMRPGLVVGTGRTKVKVRFVRNATGATDERSFGPLEVAPAAADAHRPTPVTRTAL